MTVTKHELTVAVDDLEKTLASCEATLERTQDGHRRELAESRRLFMELYSEKRTLGLRFGWLEEAATDAVNACEKHAEQNLDRLRDELGLEMKGD